MDSSQQFYWSIYCLCFCVKKKGFPWHRTLVWVEKVSECLLTSKVICTKLLEQREVLISRDSILGLVCVPRLASIWLLRFTILKVYGFVLPLPVFSSQISSVSTIPESIKLAITSFRNIAWEEEL
jgi:hypothetical protein